jgi:hypothetical protein
MCNQPDATGFQPINRGYRSVFHSGRLSLGVVVPLETYDQGAVATMKHHLECIQRAALTDEFSTASGKYFDNDAGQFAAPHPDTLDEATSAEVMGAIEQVRVRLAL